MDFRDVSDLITQGESASLEFKKSTSLLDNAGETLCAFLNSNLYGGTVIVGVKDNGEIVGQMTSDNTRKEIAQMTARFEPAVQINIDFIPVDKEDKFLIVLRTKPHPSDRPYAYRGKSYQRIESSTRLMPQNSKKHLLLENMQIGHYEDLVTTHTDLSLLDESLIRKMVEIGINVNRLPESASNESIADLLQERLHMLKDGYITNAALILFGKNLKAAYPQCFLKLAFFQGKDILSNMLDSQQLHGNAFEILHQAMNFIQRNVKVSSEFDEHSMQRKDIPQVPIIAIRELMVNAICHRDYSDKTGEITVAIFNDRLEVWNNGRLHSDLSIAKLKQKHSSRRINPKIAEVFYFCQYIDRWGMGTLRVLELCKKYGMPEPDFKEESGGISATIYFLLGIKKLIENEQFEFSDRQVLILQLIDRQKELSFQQVKEMLNLNISDRTLRNDLMLLKQYGVLTLIGRGQYARWKRLKQ